jgi:hypothetical protein
MRLQPIVTACLLAGMTLVLYGFGLRAAPLTPDERAVTEHARTIGPGATPLFVHVQDERWLQPMAVYATAAVQRAGGGDFSGRIVSTIAAAIDVAMIFLVAELITARAWVGLVAALLLMLTPSHRELGMSGTDAILPAPLILLWLWNLIAFLKRDSIRALVAAALWLGLTIYSHPTAPLVAAYLWLLTLIVARRRALPRLAIATVAFAIVWIPVALWFARHFNTYADTYGRWVIFAAHLHNPLDGWRALTNTNTLGNRVSAFWGFWDPSWLFFRARDAAAPFLLIAAPLVALGIHRFVMPADRHTAMLIAGGALIVTAIGATFGFAHYIGNAAAVIPLVTLTAALGADHLVNLIRPPAPPPES